MNLLDRLFQDIRRFRHESASLTMGTSLSRAYPSVDPEPVTLGRRFDLFRITFARSLWPVRRFARLFYR